MPINFLQENFKTESSRKEFGLCDDIPNSPAYIDENDRLKWIALVKNPNNKEIDFYAIDNCVIIKRPNGEIESSCEGVLVENSTLTFVELKERAKGQWFKTT